LDRSDCYSLGHLHFTGDISKSFNGLVLERDPMIEFPPEFYGMVAALWATYQYTIVIWLALMFGCVLFFGFGIIAWNIIRPIWNI
jgi:hypothetical protein